MKGRHRVYAAAFTLMFAAVLFLAAGPIPAQAPQADFEVDIVSVKSDDGLSSRLDVYTRVPNATLKFLNTTDGFTARYDVTARVHRVNNRNRRQQLLVTRTFEHTSTTTTFAQTQSRQLYDRNVQSLAVDPGNYIVEVRVNDRSSGRVFEREVPVVVRNFSKAIAISDIVLLDSYDQARNTISPNVSAVVGTNNPRFKVFFEVYAARPEKVRLVREVVRLAGRGFTPIQIVFGQYKKKEDLGDLAYSNTEPIPVKAGRQPMISEFALPDLKSGDYLIRIKAEDEQGNLQDVAQKIINAQWTGLDQHIRDLNQAVDQLTYIAKRKEIKAIKNAPNDSERYARFKAFWAKRDPTPGTDRNERMEEYYYRVATANTRFGSGSFNAGWKTDRGQVIILYGEPEQVERRPSTSDGRPFEVWYYYRIGRHFIFVDETGFGDYELAVPIWDERTRIR